MEGLNLNIGTQQPVRYVNVRYFVFRKVAVINNVAPAKPKRLSVQPTSQTGSGSIGLKKLHQYYPVIIIIIITSAIVLKFSHDLIS